MDIQTLAARGLVLLGCGKMGTAMLQGWLAQGLPARSVWVQDPKPSDWLLGLDGLHLNTRLPANPAVILVAVKPQMMAAALPQLAPLGDGDCLFVSVAAGTRIACGNRSRCLNAGAPDRSGRCRTRRLPLDAVSPP